MGKGPVNAGLVQGAVLTLVGLVMLTGSAIQIVQSANYLPFSFGVVGGILLVVLGLRWVATGYDKR
jgi:hypothetical protein